MNRKTKHIMVIGAVVGFTVILVSVLMPQSNVLMAMGLAGAVGGVSGGIVSVIFRIFEKQPNKPKDEQKQ